MTDIQSGATIVVELLIVLAFVAMAAYEVIHEPSGDLTKLLVGAMIAAFGSITTHLFGQLAAGPVSRPAPPPASVPGAPTVFDS